MFRFRSRKERLQNRLEKLQKKQARIDEKLFEQYDYAQLMFDLYMQDISKPYYMEKRQSVNKAIDRLNNQYRNLDVAASKIRRKLRAC